MSAETCNSLGSTPVVVAVESDRVTCGACHAQRDASFLPVVADAGGGDASRGGHRRGGILRSQDTPGAGRELLLLPRRQRKEDQGESALDTREGILKGGESNTPAVVANKLDDSTLIRAIRWTDEDLQMPPKKKLPAQQIADFEAWVNMGAPMPVSKISATQAAPSAHPVGLTLTEGRKFWSFIPPHDSQSPKTANTTWAHSDVDRFILADLEAQKLAPSAAADKRTLIRRATYDLIGLPPTLTEIDDFLADASPDAFAKVVDRLLASQHYGERWGRHWLDVAHYADTKGYVFNEERRYPFSYTYRDWVIRSLNEDLPYDQFLIDQIAADRVDHKADTSSLAALGFLTLGRRFLNAQADIIDDRIDVVCRGTMALTVGCAAVTITNTIRFQRPTIIHSTAYSPARSSRRWVRSFPVQNRRSRQRSKPSLPRERLNGISLSPRVSTS